MFGFFRSDKSDGSDSAPISSQSSESVSEAQGVAHDCVDPQDRDPEDLEARIIAAIRTVHDPEIPVNVYDLGLIYELNTSEDGDIKIEMTLTAPACPVAGSLPSEVERAVAQLPGVRSARVELVWDPPWSAERMSEEAKLELGLL